MDVLITAIPQDTHASVVYAALTHCGVDARLLYLANFPSISTHSVRIDKHVETFRASEPPLELGAGATRTVWFRRPSRAGFPEGPIDDQDALFVNAINRTYGAGLWGALKTMVGPDTRWINEPAAASRAQDKATQLLEARRVGLTIPDTLITNDAADVAAFLAEHGNDIIVKGHLPCMWVDDQGGAKWAPTSRLRELDPALEDAVRMQSAIYQEVIEPEYEVRSVIFGDTIHSVRIKTTQGDDGVLDWRSRFPLDHVVEEYRLRESEEASIRALFKRLNLHTASVDMIRTRQGELVFLEVNEQGNFLWMEQMLPSLHLLSDFCAYLVGDTSAAITDLRLCDATELDTHKKLDEQIKNYVRPTFYGEKHELNSPPSS